MVRRSARAERSSVAQAMSEGASEFSKSAGTGGNATLLLTNHCEGVNGRGIFPVHYCVLGLVCQCGECVNEAEISISVGVCTECVSPHTFVSCSSLANRRVHSIVRCATGSSCGALSAARGCTGTRPLRTERHIGT